MKWISVCESILQYKNISLYQGAEKEASERWIMNSRRSLSYTHELSLDSMWKYLNQREKIDD